MFITQITTDINIFHTFLIAISVTVTIILLASSNLPRLDSISGANNDDLENKINKKMEAILKGGGNCLISTRNFTWGISDNDSDMFNVLKSKSERKEITILIPKKAYRKLSDEEKFNLKELEQKGATVHKYNGDGIGRSFTITHFTSNGEQQIAIAERVDTVNNKHRIRYIGQKQNRDLFALLTQSIKAIA